MQYNSNKKRLWCSYRSTVHRLNGDHADWSHHVWCRHTAPGPHSCFWPFLKSVQYLPLTVHCVSTRAESTLQNKFEQLSYDCKHKRRPERKPLVALFTQSGHIMMEHGIAMMCVLFSTGMRAYYFWVSLGWTTVFIFLWISYIIIYIFSYTHLAVIHNVFNLHTNFPYCCRVNVRPC